MAVTIKKVVTGRQLRQFIDLPHHLYKGDPNYVPELYITQKKLFDKKKNPFFKHSETELFLAYKNKKVVGRVALVNNGNYNALSAEQHGFFGFFDVMEDYEVAEKLLDTVMKWAAQKHFSAVIGPVNFSVNDTCGMLIDGFDSPPVIMMTYHKKFHNDFLERYGFIKKMDLLAYKIVPKGQDRKVVKLHHLLEERLKRNGIVIRKLDLKKFHEEVAKLHKIYNEAWEKNWGFVPMTKEEFDFAAEDMKAIIDVDFAYIAEHDGRAIGFSLAIPNLNEAFIRIRRGRLLPTGIFKLLYYKNKVKSVRIITLGVIEGYRKSGIDACFYARNLETAHKKNIQWAEASWILENNQLMNRALENIGAEVYKKYRIYEHALA